MRCRGLFSVCCRQSVMFPGRWWRVFIVFKVFSCEGKKCVSSSMWYWWRGTACRELYQVPPPITKWFRFYLINGGWLVHISILLHWVSWIVFNIMVSCNSKLIEMGVMLQLNGCGFPKRYCEIYFLWHTHSS